MKEYICRNCGKPWYSACESKDHYYPECEECGGELEEKEETAPVVATPRTVPGKVKLLIF